MLSRQIASKLRGYETPFYLYDMALLRQTLESVVYESKKYGYKVHYAIKANYDDHLLAIIREYGLGIDCASGNELRKAVEAGFDPKGIVYAGVGKRDKELRYAIGQEIMAINCESIEELELVDRLAGEAGKKTDVALRRALKAKTDNATVIIVAQRISTVLHANQILVLDEGRLVGKGTHAQLMESCPAYQEIARSQLSQKELNLQKEGE